jgi:hypothetical protein
MTSGREEFLLMTIAKVPIVIMSPIYTDACVSYEQHEEQ